ncbi:MAG: type IV secretory system conjugative DNA transfer family protein [Bacteriovoracia bacterium]
MNRNSGMECHLNRPEKFQKEPKETSAMAATGIVAIAVCALVYLYSPQLMHFYIKYYYAVWSGFFIFLLLLFAGLLAILHVKTEDLRKRAKLVLPLTKKDSGIFVGKTKDGLPLYLSEELRCGHTQILAATGRGKTMSVIIPWTVRDIKKGRSVVLVDGKGDPDILRPIEKAIDRLKSPAVLKVFDLGNPNRSVTINPLANGTAQQITDRIFTAFTFQDPYYRAVQYHFCGRVISLIQETEGTVTFKRLYELLTEDRQLLEAKGRSKDESVKEYFKKWHSDPQKERMQKLMGLISQIGPFAIGEVSELVNGDPKAKDRYVSLSELILTSGEERKTKGMAEQQALIFLIPTLKYQNIGHQLGKLISQELGWAVGVRANDLSRQWEFTPVSFDEFSAFVYEGFHNILNKARSSNLALQLSHQSSGDLAIVSKEFADIINTNTNNKALLGLNDPVSADFYAKHLGTYTDAKLTERAQTKPLFGKKEKTGEVSIRDVEAYKVHPNVLKNFTAGKGVLHVPTKKGNVTEEIQFAALSDKDFERG